MPFRADRLLALQRKQGYTNRYLAGVIGVNENTIRRWINEGRQPGTLSLNQLAAVLNTNIDYLLGNTEDSTPPPGDIGDLSDEEQRLLWAYRRGGRKAILRLLGEDDE